MLQLKTSAAIAANDSGLLPWRTSNLMNVPAERLKFPGKARSQQKPWRQTALLCAGRRGEAYSFSIATITYQGTVRVFDDLLNCKRRVSINSFDLLNQSTKMFVKKSEKENSDPIQKRCSMEAGT